MGNELVLLDHDFNSAAGQVDQLSRHSGVCRKWPLTLYRGHATDEQGYLCHHGSKAFQGEPALRFQP